LGANDRAGIKLRYDQDEFRNRLLIWYRKHKRPLPWRSNPTPYRVWISEIMLQQTQAATASSYYVRFLERFPNLEALAKASEPQILALWSGLGYYHRAQNLHKAAREIIQRFSGIFPSDFKTILSLPGIGRYTAGAICSLAMNQHQPIVDGNIRRVITRFNGIRERALEKYFWDQMELWIPEGEAAIFNQAMMELGAMTCTPSHPRCDKCPIKHACRAYNMNLQNDLPQPRPKRPAQNVAMVVLVLQNKNKVLLTNDIPAYIPGQWGLPSQPIDDQDSAEDAAQLLSRSILGADIRLSYSSQIRHAISHRRILAHLFIGKADDALDLASSGLRWTERPRSSAMLTSSLFIKALMKTIRIQTYPDKHR
jgi:A/G-specific adenine glycosylase